MDPTRLQPRVYGNSWKPLNFFFFLIARVTSLLVLRCHHILSFAKRYHWFVYYPVILTNGLRFPLTLPRSHAPSPLDTAFCDVEIVTARRVAWPLCSVLFTCQNRNSCLPLSGSTLNPSNMQCSLNTMIPKKTDVHQSVVYICIFVEWWWLFVNDNNVTVVIIEIMIIMASVTVSAMIRTVKRSYRRPH